MPVTDNSAEASIADDSERVKLQSSDAIKIRVSDNIIESPFLKYLYCVRIIADFEKWNNNGVVQKVMQNETSTIVI